MDGASRREYHVTDCFHAKLRWNSNLTGDLFHTADTKLPVIFINVSMSGIGKSLAPVRIIGAGPPPIRDSFFPEQPFFSRFVSEKDLALKSLGDSEPLCTFAD